MSDWKIKSSSPDALGMVIKTVGTGGLNLLLGDKADTTYTVEHRETGERRTVTTSDKAALGRALSRKK
ncbi:MAG: hypothetical protein AAF439_02355 [Pseudomonadota bacterium]